MKLLKTKDLGYVTMKKLTEQKKISKLKDSLQGITVEPQNKHTVFVDSTQEANNFSAVEFFQTIPEAVNRTFNRPKLEDLQSTQLTLNKYQPRLVQIEKEQKKHYDELLTRVDRDQKIGQTLQIMQLQKNLLGKGKRKKVKSDNENNSLVFKWERIRKQ